MENIDEIEYAIMELTEPEFMELKEKMDKFYWKKWGGDVEVDIKGVATEWDSVTIDEDEV